jgi:peroxiredoxin
MSAISGSHGGEYEDGIGEACRQHKIMNAYKVLVGEIPVKSLLGRHTFSWEDNIKIYFKEIWCEIVD